MMHPLEKHVAPIAKPSLTLSLLSLGLAAHQPVLSAEQPNIVVIYADDLGYTDVGAYGAKYYETPNIDNLAKGGVTFTAAYASSPNCAPSRGALYSGQYCGRTGMYNVGWPERGKAENRSLIPPPNCGDLPLDRKSFGTAMTNLGYTCVQFGKWHLGFGKQFVPPARGFKGKWTTGPHKGLFMSETLFHPSLWAHFHYGPAFGAKKGKGDGAFHIIFGDYEDPRNNKAEGFKVTDETLVKRGTYLSDYMDEKTPAMLADLKSQGKPFLLMLNHYLVHGPVNAPEADVARFKDKEADGADKDPTFAAMVKKLDDSVGVVMTSLKELDLLDNTIVFFYSDNGGVGGYHRLGIRGAGEHTGNDPLKGGKTMLYEGGIRVPLIVYHRGRIPAGTMCHEPVAGIDFFPTFLELAGTGKEAFSEAHSQPLDGHSMVPLFKSPNARLDREFLAFHFPAYALGYFGEGPVSHSIWRSTPHSAIRTRQYKLMEHYVGEELPGDGSRLELYDIANDIGETKNIASSKPEVVKELHQKLENWRRQTGAKLPVKKSPLAKDYVQVQGLIVTNLTPDLRRAFSYSGPGVFVISADPKRGWPNAIRSSAIISSINGRQPKDINEFKDMVAAQIGKPLKFEVVLNSRRSKEVAVTVNSMPEAFTPDASKLNDFQPYSFVEDRIK